MSKLQTMFGLLLFLVIIFSMDMIFGNPLRETFSGRTGNRIGVSGSANVGLDGGNIGSSLDYIPKFRTNTLNGNMIYSGRGFLGENMHYSQGDDQPLFFGFSI